MAVVGEPSAAAGCAEGAEPGVMLEDAEVNAEADVPTPPSVRASLRFQCPPMAMSQQAERRSIPLYRTSGRPGWGTRPRSVIQSTAGHGRACQTDGGPGS